MGGYLWFCIRIIPSTNNKLTNFFYGFYIILYSDLDSLFSFSNSTAKESIEVDFNLFNFKNKNITKFPNS